MILTFSAVLGGWTIIILLSNSNSNSNFEIKEVIHKMYLNQKNFIFNVKDLSILLVRDANQRFFNDKNDIEHLNNLKSDFKIRS